MLFLCAHPCFLASMLPCFLTSLPYHHVLIHHSLFPCALRPAAMHVITQLITIRVTTQAVIIYVRFALSIWSGVYETITPTIEGGSIKN